MLTAGRAAIVAAIAIGGLTVPGLAATFATAAAAQPGAPASQRAPAGSASASASASQTAPASTPAPAPAPASQPVSPATAPASPPGSAPASLSGLAPAPPPAPPAYETIVEGEAPLKGADGAAVERPHSAVRRSELERRLPRSAPDAIRWEPGVFVQQTAHAQGSAYIRGLTGQQTLLLFDGIRLNTSTYRQGPNQYFFTLDSQTLDSIEVERGGASTRWGSDALGGAIIARPIEPTLGAPGEVAVRPSLRARATTADDERGGRMQVEAGGWDRVGLLVGMGARTVGLLESGGVVHSPADGGVPEVPRFAEDGRTQLGTGFDELTGDGRLVVEVTPRDRVTLSAYAYRQFDAPRTDLCPPPAARWDECLTYDEQFRTLVYGAYDALRDGFWRSTRVTLSFQLQHERRDAARPASYVDNLGRDDVATLGVAAVAHSATWRPARAIAMRLEVGADTYRDTVSSAAWQSFTDLGVVRELSRGQYLDGSSYVTGGAFTDAQAHLPADVTLRAGGRVAWVVADAPGDPESGSAAIDNSWFPVVGHAGLAWRPWNRLTLLANVDRSYRAPNLDDLTSRQQTGPGFQFENADLQPERATTVEVGARLVASRVEIDAWAYRMGIQGAIGRAQRDAADCPPETPGCAASWSRFQLVNAGSAAEVRGVEAVARLHLPARVRLRATAAWAWGEGPNLSERPSDPTLPYQERVPLSRIPPLNGTVEATWRAWRGLGLSAGLMWAAKQDRLAVSDLSDARIPLGGTPGFAVCDVRAFYRHSTRYVVTLALENVLDAAYRVHGSSVNGPGRGLVLSLEATPW